MSNIKQLVVEGKFDDALKLTRETSISELQDIVEHFENLGEEGLQNLIVQVREEIKSKELQKKEIENEAIEYNKQKIAEQVQDNKKLVSEIETKLANIEPKFASELANKNEQNSRPCECGGQMKVRSSYKGSFLGCNQYPRCKKTSDMTTLSDEAQTSYSEYKDLEWEKQKAERFNKQNSAPAKVKPLYTKELSEKSDAVYSEVRSLRRTESFYNNLLKGENPFKSALATAIKNEEMRPYITAFQHKPFLKDEVLVENFEKLKNVEKTIKEKLANFDNFAGIDFCSVSSGGIQIRAFHKQVSGYAYGDSIKLENDLSNADTAVDELVEMWKAADNDERLKSYQSFLADGQKYGWD